ncbi:MAG: hypothetical protein JST54_12490 [Deltaproteobacteria bacterium]|nr:hypothetical protein [Deltaproteobacteria bacterium]
MSQIDEGAKAGAAQTVAAVLTALALAGGAGAWLYTRAPQPTDVLVRSTALVADAKLPALGAQVVALPDGGAATAGESVVFGVDGGFVALSVHGGQPLHGASYWRIQICAPIVDGGHDPGPSFLGAGVQVVYDDDQVGGCVDGGPVIEAWQQGRSDAPFPCACSTGSSCSLSDGGAAPTGITLQPGWAGAGCFPKACVELAGSSSWPQECPQ